MYETNQQTSDAVTDRPSEEEIKTWLVAKFAEVLGEKPEKIDIKAPINGFGLGSIQLVSLIGELEDWLDIELPGTLLWEIPTIGELISFLVTYDGEPEED